MFVIGMASSGCACRSCTPPARQSPGSPAVRTRLQFGGLLLVGIAAAGALNVVGRAQPASELWTSAATQSTGTAHSRPLHHLRHVPVQRREAAAHTSAERQPMPHAMRAYVPVKEGLQVCLCFVGWETCPGRSWGDRLINGARRAGTLPLSLFWAGRSLRAFLLFFFFL